MKRGFLVATHEQIRAIVLLSVLLLFSVFAPTMRWIGQALVRGARVRSGNVQLMVPETWMVRKKNHVLEVWKPCLTIFCSRPSAEIVIQTEDLLSADEQIWEHGAETVLKGLGFSEFVTREINNPGGAITCIEANHGVRGQELMSTCFQPVSGISATMTSRTGRLDPLYEIFATAARTN